MAGSFERVEGVAAGLWQGCRDANRSVGRCMQDVDDSRLHSGTPQHGDLVPFSTTIRIQFFAGLGNAYITRRLSEGQGSNLWLLERIQWHTRLQRLRSTVSSQRTQRNQY